MGRSCKTLRKLDLGEIIDLGLGLNAKITHKSNGTATLCFNKSGQELDDSLYAIGSMPLPPYIEKKIGGLKGRSRLSNDMGKRTWVGSSTNCFTAF